MNEEWLIDGYNLLHDAALEVTKGKKMSRESLFGILASFAFSDQSEVLIVLDGQGNDEEFRPFETKSFRIIYSQDKTK